MKPGDDIQEIAEGLRAGDELRFAPGIYRQAIVIRARGTAEKPIRIIGGAGVRFEGRTLLDLEWRAGGAGVYEAEVDHAVRQLFADGRLLTPARWPDMTFAQRWDNSKWPAADAGSRYGTMVDSDLAEADMDFTGCVAILNIGSWQTFRRVITSHAKGQDRFTYPTDPGSRLHSAKHPVGMDRYCIYGKAALDVPGEWFFDGKASTLSLIPPKGRRPDQLVLTSKTLAEAIVVEDSAHVHLTGFQFRGTTLRVQRSNHCVIEDIDIEFGSTIANPFGPNLSHPALEDREWGSRKWFGETSVDALTFVGGDGNIIRDLRAKFSEGPGLTASGRGNLIDNCLFRDIDWHGLDYGFGIDLLAAAPITVRNVTLDHCGGSEGLRLANHGKSLVEYCHLHHCGLRQSDGAIIQTSTARMAGTEIRYNWIHDHNAFHWGGNGIRGDDGTRGLVVHHNVVWNCAEKGIVTKGDGNRIYHNTCFNNPRIDILMPRNRLPRKEKELLEQNKSSEAFNNIGHVTGSWIWEKPKQAPLGESGNNLAGGVELLREATVMDFRLKPGSPAIDRGRAIEGISEEFEGAAPDLGAHEFDQPRWRAGYRAPRPAAEKNGESR